MRALQTAGSYFFNRTGKKLLKYEFLFLSFAQRSYELLWGMTVCIRARNFGAAATLLRPLVDSYNFAAVLLLCDENREAIAMKKLAGADSRECLDDTSMPLTDSRMKEYGAAFYPAARSIYDVASKFIHYSEEHCRGMARVITGVPYEGEIGKALVQWSEFEKDDLIRAAYCLAAGVAAVLEKYADWRNDKTHEELEAYYYPSGLDKPPREHRKGVDPK